MSYLDDSENRKEGSLQMAGAAAAALQLRRGSAVTSAQQLAPGDLRGGGAGRSRLADKEFALEGGDDASAPPGTMHSFAFTRPTDFQ